MQKKDFYSLTDSLKNETELRSEMVSLTELSEVLKAKAEELTAETEAVASRATALESQTAALATQVELKLDGAPVDGKAYIQKDGLWQEIDPLIETVATIANPNLLINGDFSVWQRGDSFTDLKVLTYTADRWMVSAFDKVLRDTHESISDHTVSYTVMRMITPPQNLSVYKVLDQIIENGAALLTNQQVTISFLIVGTILYDFFHRIEFMNYPEGTVLAYSDVLKVHGEWHHGDWKRVSCTLTLPSLATKTTSPHLRFRISWKPEIPSDVFAWISEVKLEYGPNATPFIPDDPATNLAKCQRYYFQAMNNGTLGIIVNLVHDTGTGGYPTSVHYLPTTMRASPTITVYAWGEGASMGEAGYLYKIIGSHPTGDQRFAVVSKPDRFTLHPYETVAGAGLYWGYFIADAEL